MEDKLPTIRREEVKHSPPPRQAQFDTLSQEVAEEGQSVVQLHLFVVESQWEGHGARNVPAQTQSQDPPQGQAQAHAVVPDTVKSNIVLRVSSSQVGFFEVAASMCWCGSNGWSRVSSVTTIKTGAKNRTFL